MKNISKTEQKTTLVLSISIFVIVMSTIIFAGVGLAKNVKQIEKNLKQQEEYKQTLYSVCPCNINYYFDYDKSEKVEKQEEKNAVILTATAYCSCEKCCGKNDGITATGTTATAGRTIAVDPSVIPYGTEIIINGHTYVAEDCGGSIKGNAIDIFFDNHEEAVEFGRQTITAYANMY